MVHSAGSKRRQSVYDITKIKGYKLGKTLGEGSFAVVREGTHFLTDETVAVKVFDKRRIFGGEADEYIKKNLHREPTILAKLHHPNIVKLYEVFENDDILCMVTQLSHVDVLKDLCENGVKSENEVRRLTRQLISAVDHWQSHGVVHRDLKCENLMLNRNNDLVVIDFGLGNDMTGKDHLMTRCGSMAYSAPEMLSHKPYGKEVDVWSIGVCMFVMLTGHLPFVSDKSMTEQHAAMLDGQFNLPSSHSSELHELFSKIFQVKPQKRITLQELTTDPWITKDMPKDEKLLGVSDGPVELASLNVDIVRKLVDMGFEEPEAVKSILKNSCDQYSAAYQLLAAKEVREKEEAEARSKVPLPKPPSRRMRRSISESTSYGSTRRGSMIRKSNSVEARRGTGSSSSGTAGGNQRSSSDRSQQREAAASPRLRRYSTSGATISRPSTASRPRSTRGRRKNKIEEESYPALLDAVAQFLRECDGTLSAAETSKLERLAYKALVKAPNRSLVTCLRRHGWNGVGFRGLQDITQLIESLETMSQEAFGSDSTSPRPSRGTSPSRMRTRSSSVRAPKARSRVSDLPPIRQRRSPSPNESVLSMGSRRFSMTERVTIKSLGSQ